MERWAKQTLSLVFILAVLILVGCDKTKSAQKKFM